MIKLIDILNEVINNNIILDKNLQKSTNTDDPFIINKTSTGKTKSLGGITTYYGLYPNPNYIPNSDSEKITSLYNSIKDGKTNVSLSDLNLIVLLTAPSKPIRYILPLPSSSDLNKTLVKLLQKKYNLSDEKVLNTVSKIEYFIDDMVNIDKYNKAHPVTQSILNAWIAALKKRYGNNAKIPIKKSGSETANHPGLKSGARGLLNKVYNLGFEEELNDNILVVDDFVIGGTSLKEIYNDLIEIGINPNKIQGYCLGVKEVNLPSTKQEPLNNPNVASIKSNSSISNEITQIQNEISKINNDPEYKDWQVKLKNKPQSEFFQNKVKEFKDKLDKLEKDLKDAKERSFRVQR